MQPLHVRPAKGVRFAFALLVSLTLLSLQCLSALGTSSLRAAEAATVEEYVTPSPDSSPTDLRFDSQGTLWFTMINANKIGRLVPSEARAGRTNGITEYTVPTPNSNPHYLAFDAQDRVWFTERLGNKIGMLDPGRGQIQEYEIPTPRSEPHHLAFDAKGHTRSQGDASECCLWQSGRVT